MKTLFLVCLFGCFFVNPLFAAQDTFTCGTTGSTQGSSQSGGLYLPSQGTLKVLVVFVRFKDDTDPHGWWPAGGNPDGWDTFIDPNTQTGSTNLINLTNYFSTMSLGTFHVIGQAVSVETPRNRADYGTDYYTATKEVLQQKVDPLVNFNDYDNWTYNSDYHFTNQSDTTVDMIVMIWRGKPWVNLGWYGIAKLGAGASYTVESGTKTIKTDFGGSSGSGVTVNCSGVSDQKYTFHATVHEIAHWLLGGNHPYGLYAHGFWGDANRLIFWFVCKYL